MNRELFTEGQPIEWSFDAGLGRVQGPLDLMPICEQRLALTLTEGQQALLVQEGRLKAVYLDGAHCLEIGTEKQQIDPAGQLWLVAIEEPLHLSWSRSRPLQWGPAEHQELIGSCTLHIDWPSRFFATFLQGLHDPDPGYAERIIDQTMRGLFAEILAVGESGDEAPGPGHVQEHLMRLVPADLNVDLNEYGLNCIQLAVYTLAPPVEDHETAETPELELITGR